MSDTTTKPKNALSPEGELVPAEANAREAREGDNFLRSSTEAGATVDQEGLTNIHAVEPNKSYASDDSPQKKRQLSLTYAVATWGLIALAIAVTFWLR